MLAIKSRFEGIKNLKEENLSFDDYLHLKEVVKALARLKTVNCVGIILVDNLSVIRWIKRNKLACSWLDVSLFDDRGTYALSWRHK